MNDHSLSAHRLTHLRELEAESIHIIREVAAEFDKPVMLFSMGKDSMVMFWLARKAFAPGRLPFPMLHIDTTWQFDAMIRFRDDLAARYGVEILAHTNEEGRAEGINPFDHGAHYTHTMNTVALRQALTAGGYDAAFGGARRDEERARAKERIYSFRDMHHQWDPKNQRPELWRLYNGRHQRGESIRVFPLSNWTELDIWQYIHLEDIPLVPLYYAAERPVVWRDGQWILVEDERMRFEPDEEPQQRWVRFRTLGCYPTTGCIESTATSVPEIIHEMLTLGVSERAGRVVDREEEAAMEKKKREGYF